MPTTDLATLRDAAAHAWQLAGWPTPRLEAWKHTNLRAVEATSWTPAPAAAALDLHTGPLPGTVGTLVLVDGALNLDASTLPEGVQVRSLPEGAPPQLGSIAETKRLEDALVARNLAKFDRGVTLHVAQGVVAGPVELRFLTTDRSTPWEAETRVFIALAPHAELTLVERHLSTSDRAYLINQVTEVSLAPGARLRHTQVQRQGAAATHLSKVAVHQERDSRYEAQVLQLGAALGRSDIEVYLREPGASCQLDGLYHGRGTQHLDNHSAIHHLADHTQSGEHYKGVLDERATGVFRGNVLIHAGARGCSTAQLNRNLLLSDKATVHTKPQLEIDNDDVTASHGATIGQLDDKALFYLRSRGIPKDTARQLLIFAFVAEILTQLPLESLRDGLHEELAKRLAEQTGEIGV